jgi:hypothetical protein
MPDRLTIVNGAWTVWAVCFGLPIAWVLAAVAIVVLSPVWLYGRFRHWRDWGSWCNCRGW